MLPEPGEISLLRLHGGMHPENPLLLKVTYDHTYEYSWEMKKCGHHGTGFLLIISETAYRFEYSRHYNPLHWCVPRGHTVYRSVTHGPPVRLRAHVSALVEVVFILRHDFSLRNFVNHVWLTTHIHLMPKLRMRGAIPPLPHTSSWPGA